MTDQSSTGQGSTPRSVSLYTAALAVMACLAAVVVSGDPGPVHWFGAAALLVTLVVAGSLQLEFHYGRDVEALDVFDAVLAPAIFALPAPLTVAAVAVAKLSSQLLKGVEPVKLRFNTAQWAAAAGAGSLVFHLGGGRGEPTPRNLALLAAAMVVVSVINHLAVVGVLRLTGRGSLRQVLAALAPVMLSGWVAAGLLNLAFGLIFVAAWSAVPAATPLFLVPLGLLHWANRNYAEARADRSRLAGLQQATRSLLEPVDPRTALPAFLAEVRGAFEVGVAELILGDGDGPGVVHRCDGQGHSVRPSHPDSAGAWAAAASSFASATAVTPGCPQADVARDLVGGGEWHLGLVAPVRSDDRLAGFLCLHERVGLGGFVQGELAVLDVLAAEVGGGLRKGELLDVILDERQRFSEIVNQTADGIATLAVDGRVLSWNPGFTRISGFSEADVRGGAGIDLLAARDADGDPVELGRWAEGRHLPAEIEVSGKGGERRWLACSYSQVRDSADATRRLILIARDITEGRMLQQARDQLREADARLRALRESEERVGVLLRNASDIVAVLGHDGTVAYCSHRQDASSNVVMAPEPGQRWEMVVHPDDRARLRGLLDGVAPGPGTTERVEYRLASANGGWRHVETVVTNLRGQPPVDGVVLNTKDITDRKRAEALLACETAILGLIAREEALDEILRRVVAGVEAQLGGRRATIAFIEGQRVQVIADSGLNALERAILAAQVEERAGIARTARPDRDSEPAITDDHDWVLHPLTGSGGTTLGYLCLDQPDPGQLDAGLLGLFAGLAVVAVERHRSRAQLTHQATHDGLTGLPNRSTFLDRLSMAFARSRRSRSWAAVMYCDLDKFKAINDTLGHDAGDQLLVAFGRRLMATVRPGDTAARLGGDEFSVLCEDLNDPSEATRIAERIRRALAEPFDVAGQRLVVPPSIGVAVVGGGGDPQEVMERADAAMYRAKRNGGNQWEVTELVAQVP